MTIARISREGRESAPVDLLSAFTAMATDVIGELCFGIALKVLRWRSMQCRIARNNHEVNIL